MKQLHSNPATSAGRAKMHRRMPTVAVFAVILTMLALLDTPVYAETVLVTTPNGGELISGEYITGFTINGGGSYSATMFYNAMAMQGSGTEIAKIADTKNSAACSISGSTTTCEWPWDTTAVGSGKYYFTIKVSGGSTIACSGFPCMGNFRDSTSHALFAANINCWKSTFSVGEPCYGATMSYCSGCCNGGVYSIYNNFNGTFDVACNGSLKKSGGFEISDISDAQFTIDNDAPIASGHSPAPGGYSNNPLQGINVTLSDAHSDVNKYSVCMQASGTRYCYGADAELNYDENTGLLAFTPSAEFTDGIVGVLLEARDTAGNLLAPPAAGASWSFMIDTNSPSARIEGVNANWSNKDEILIGCIEPENESGCAETYWYGFDDNADVNSCSFNPSDYDSNGTLGIGDENLLAMDSDANSYLCLLVADLAGNFGTGISSRLRVDATAPTTNHDAPTGWQNIRVDVNFACKDLGYIDGTGDESGSGCADTFYRIDGNAWADGNVAAISTDGNHQIDYYSVDNAGNIEALNAVWVAIDTTPPEGSISGVENAWVASDDVTVSCDDGAMPPARSDCAGNIWYYLDSDGACDANKATYAGSTATGGITVNWDENRYLCIWVEDAAGNSATAGSAPAKFSVDALPPSTESDSNSAWQNFDANVHLTCTDAGSGCMLTQFMRDFNAGSDANFGLGWEAWSDGNGIVFSIDGNWALVFNSTDNLGHVEDAKTVYVLIDKTPPAINIDSSAASGSDATIEYAGSDALSGISRYEVRVDSGEWLPNGISTAYTFSSQPNGSHAYSVRAYDLAGNFAGASATVTISTGNGGGNGDDDGSDGDGGGGGSGGGGGGGGGTGGDWQCKPAPVGLGIGVSGWLCAANEECTGGIHWASPKVSGAVCCSIMCTLKPSAIMAPQECTDSGGFACSAGETCEGELLEASDTTACCTVACTPKPPTGVNCIKQGCDDGNLCTIDSCNETSGICSYSIAENGTQCENGMECQNGRCVAVETVFGKIEGPTALAILSPASITAGLLLLALAVMLYAAHRKRRAKAGKAETTTRENGKAFRESHEAGIQQRQA